MLSNVEVFMLWYISVFKKIKIGGKMVDVKKAQDKKNQGEDMRGGGMGHMGRGGRGGGGCRLVLDGIHDFVSHSMIE